jgi:hypothetical protein
MSADRCAAARLRECVEQVADRLHAAGDAEARAYGWTVDRLPWGHRRYHDPRVATVAYQADRHPTRQGRGRSW